MATAEATTAVDGHVAPGTSSFNDPLASFEFLLPKMVAVAGER